MVSTARHSATLTQTMLLALRTWGTELLQGLKASAKRRHLSCYASKCMLKRLLPQTSMVSKWENDTLKESSFLCTSLMRNGSPRPRPLTRGAAARSPVLPAPPVHSLAPPVLPWAACRHLPPPPTEVPAISNHRSSCHHITSHPWRCSGAGWMELWATRSSTTSRGWWPCL